MTRLLAAAALVSTLALQGCTATSTCAALEAAHAAFLQDVADNPGDYTEDDIRLERRAYLAKTVGCSIFAPPALVTK